MGEPGCGKSTLGEFVTEDLEEQGFLLATSQPATPKQILVKIASQLGVDMENLEGKTLTVAELQEAMVAKRTAEGIAEFLSKTTAFLICDDAHRLQPQIRCWLEKLHWPWTADAVIGRPPPSKGYFLETAPD